MAFEYIRLDRPCIEFSTKKGHQEFILGGIPRREDHTPLSTVCLLG